MLNFTRDQFHSALLSLPEIRRECIVIALAYSRSVISAGMRLRVALHDDSRRFISSRCTARYPSGYKSLWRLILSCLQLRDMRDNQAVNATLDVYSLEK